jgi:hypothetical protein
VIKEVKDFLPQSFEMTDLEEADVILNIKLVKESNGGVTLTQSQYVEKVLSRFGYGDCKPFSTPRCQCDSKEEQKNNERSIS